MGKIGLLYREGDKIKEREQQFEDSAVRKVNFLLEEGIEIPGIMLEIVEDGGNERNWP